MSVLSKLFRPSGRKFYDLFDEVADNLKDMSKLMKEYSSTTDRTQSKKLLDEIERMEDKNDSVTHALFVELGKNFITPFDREDIHRMATSLDDIADYIWGTAKQMYYFRIELRTDSTAKFAEELNNFAQHVDNAIEGLKNRRELTALTNILDDMRKTTSSCDDIINEAIMKTFNTEDIEPVDTIKLTDHYKMLQELNDKCGEVINVVESTIIKYA